jgi:hypothetical protein
MCKCGTIKKVSRSSLVSGQSKSCGCYNKDQKTIHGKCTTEIYALWSSIKNRCNSNHPSIKKNYKDRGISLCNEWASFLVFELWALNNGYKKGLEIDRIDNDLGYSPYNCRFVTTKENSNNKRTNRYITFDGITKTMKQWSESTGIPYAAFQKRVYDGWSIDKIIKTPLMGRFGKPREID